MISRDEAMVLIKKYLKDQENIKYALTVEAVLREIAKKLGRDEELWGLTGLLHNIDYEYTSSELEKRGILSSQLLEGLIPERGVNAIKANNYTYTDHIPTSALDKSLIAVDTLTGLIFATVRSIPSKKLNDVDLNILILKFNDSTFAVRYNRNRIKLCTDIGIELRDFFILTLETIKKISDKIDL